MEGPSQHGRYYWCVKSELSANGEIYVHADRVEVTPTGDLLLLSKSDESEHLMLGFAKGQWKACFAASLFDGAPVAVERWEGEVDRRDS